METSTPEISFNNINMKRIKEPIDLNLENLGHLSEEYTIDFSETPLFENEENNFFQKTPIQIPKSPILEKIEEINVYSKSPIINKIPIINVKPIGLLSSNNELKFNTKISDTLEKGNLSISKNRYVNLSEDEKLNKKIYILEKFEILKENFLNWEIKIPGDEYSLDQMHTIYDNYIKRISISLQCGEWKSMLALILLCFEFCCKKFLKIDIIGFAKSEMEKKYKYDRILFKLGEERYSLQSSESSAFEQLMTFTGLNAGIFIFCKYIAPYIGGDGSMEIVKNIIDNFIDGDSISKLDSYKINSSNTVENKENKENKENGGLVGMFNSLVGDSSNGDYSKLITNIGSVAGKFFNNNNNTGIVKPKVKKVIW
jgi:uncharacterized FAD-dependent dehydrogenase